LQPGDDPSEGRRINADRATVEGGALSFYVDDEVVSLFYEWTEAHRVHEWPDRPVGEIDPDVNPW
jgi:hypothetical protein